MDTYLVTVSSSETTADGVRITPGLFRADTESRPAIQQMMQGSAIELRRPDGFVIATHLVTYGVSAWRQPDGQLMVHGDPSDPEIKLTIAAAPEDVPEGTELWLLDGRE